MITQLLRERFVQLPAISPLIFRLEWHYPPEETAVWAARPHVRKYLSSVSSAALKRCAQDAVRRTEINAGSCASLLRSWVSQADWNQTNVEELRDVPNMELKMSSGMPSMTALLGLLAIAGYQNRDKLAELLGGAGGAAPGSSGTSQPLGGLLGNLGGMLSGAGAGGLLSGGIGELLERFNQNGQGDTAQSWINSGPNKEISPQQLKQAIGSDVLEKLEQQTGLSQEELLARLSRELPTAVDKYTPDGRLPAA